MAYDPENPAALITQGIGGTTGMRWFAHAWIDTITQVRQPGYITNAADIGMREGDGFLYKDVNMGEWSQYSLIVDSVDPVTGAGTVRYPDIPEDALELVTEFDIETVQLVAYSGGRQVRGPLDALIEFEDSVTKTFDVTGATTSVDLETDFDNPQIFIDGEYQQPDTYTLVDGILSPVGTWPTGQLAAWIGGTRLFISTLPEIYTADIVNFDESVTTAIEAQVPAIIIEQIVAGTNITLEETGGGQLRISSTGGGGGDGGVTEAEVIQIIKDTLVEGANISFVEDPTTITITAASSGGGGSGEDITFSSRAEAIATTISISINTILVNHASTTLRYWSDPAGTALTTAGGRKWSPAETPTPLHWGALGNGAADDHAAIQACVDSFCLTASDKSVALLNSPVAVIDGRGKRYAISEPVIIGNVGGAPGMIYNVLFQNMRVQAIGTPASWTGHITTNVPKAMFTLAWRMAADYSDKGAGIFNVKFDNVTLDCAFIAQLGWFFENTNSCGLLHFRVVRMAKNGHGIATSIGNKAQNPLGWQTGNGAFTMLDGNVAGIEEETDNDFPLVGGPAAGETQASMSVIGILWQTNDARFSKIITSRVSRAWHVDYCGALQFSDLHPWAVDFFIGQYTNNFQFSNCYFDYTRVILFGSFNHYFDNCMWALGTSDRGLELCAIAANTTGKGLMIGGRFKLDMQIYITTSGGTWVNDYLREYNLDAEFDDATAPWRLRVGKNLLLEADGTTHIQTDDPTWGRTVIRGRTATLGAGRTVAGRAAFEMYHDGAAPNPTAYLEQSAAGALNLVNNKAGGTIWIGNVASGNPESLIVNADGGWIFKRGGNINGYLNVVGAGAKIGGNLDMSSARITSLATPTTSTQGANKSYVDTVASDERLKQNVEPLAGGRDVIMALMPVEFDWRHTDDQEHRGHMAGLIAQDVERVSPDLVANRGQAEIETAEGIETIEDVKGIKQEAIMAHMILMMQQMQAEIDNLRGQLLP